MESFFNDNAGRRVGTLVLLKLGQIPVLVALAKIARMLDNLIIVKRSKQGQSIVEFAIMVPILIIMFLAIVDFGRYVYYEQSVSHTVRSALRVAVTGKVDENPDYDSNDDSSEEFFSRRETIIRAAKKNNPAGVLIEAGTDSANGNDTLILTPSDGGGPGEDVTLSLEYEFSFITPVLDLVAEEVTPDKKLMIRHSTTYRNEEFDE